MKSQPSVLEILQSRKLAALLFLGFSSGLPLFLTSRTLQAWLTEEQLSMTAVGFSGLISLPYSLKFLWSPLLDWFVPPFLDRRRGWLLITQIGLLIAIAAMAFQNPKTALQLMVINAVAIAFLSASQDIVGDAYRTDILNPLELGIGASTWVLGYRIAILATSAGAFWLAAFLPWPRVYGIMAGLMLVGIVTSFWAPNQNQAGNGTPVAPPSFIDAVYRPFVDFFQRYNWRGSLILLFVLVYKLSDALAGNMATPFLIQLGFDKGQIGTIQGGVGFFATTLGVVGGGVILTKLGLYRGLWLFGGLQALSNLGYLILANAGKNANLLIGVMCVENISAGLVTAAFLAYLMSLCSPRFSATQFALLSSLMATTNTILAAPAGIIVDQTNWPTFFLITILASIPAYLLLPVVAPWNGRPQPIEPEAPMDTPPSL